MQTTDRVTHPLPTKLLMRIMITLIVVFSLLAGYYQGRYQVWRSNNIRILDKFDVQTTKELLEKTVEVK